MDNDLKDLARQVLNEAFLAHLGIHDANGPWVASVVYVADADFNIYWMSSPEARHSKAAVPGNRAACSIVANPSTGKEFALQIEGTFEEPSHSLEREVRIMVKRGLPPPSELGGALKGSHRWYKLVPTRIELIDTPLFGYARKRVL